MTVILIFIADNQQSPRPCFIKNIDLIREKRPRRAPGYEMMNVKVEISSESVKQNKARQNGPNYCSSLFSKLGECGCKYV